MRRRFVPSISLKNFVDFFFLKKNKTKNTNELLSLFFSF